MFADGGSEGGAGMMANRQEVPLWFHENILELVVLVAQPCKYTKKSSEFYILKG